MKVALLLALLIAAVPARSSDLLILDMRDMKPLPEPPPPKECTPALVTRFVISVGTKGSPAADQPRGWQDYPGVPIDVLYHRATEGMRGFEVHGFDLRGLRDAMYAVTWRRYNTDKTEAAKITSGDEWGRVLLVIGAFYGLATHRQHGRIPEEVRIVRDGLIAMLKSQKPLVDSYLDLENALRRVFTYRGETSLAAYMGLKADVPLTGLYLEP